MRDWDLLYAIGLVSLTPRSPPARLHRQGGRKLGLPVCEWSRESLPRRPPPSDEEPAKPFKATIVLLRHPPETLGRVGEVLAFADDVLKGLPATEEVVHGLKH